MSWYYDAYPAYESVAQRKEKAQKLAKKLAAKHGPLQPAVAKGQKIASSFWGQSWNRNLERYQDYESRLPRGRSYVKNGFVLDLKVEKGRIKAMVSGSSLYEVTIHIQPLAAERWSTLKKECSGQISSLIGLLQGQLPPSVMKAVTKEESGLFPEPEDIRFDCTCPDYVDLCKHSAAAAYGIGARLDEEPHLLFLLRGVDHTELISGAGAAVMTQTGGEDADATELEDLSGIFGIDLETSSPDALPAAVSTTDAQPPGKPVPEPSARGVRIFHYIGDPNEIRKKKTFRKVKRRPRSKTRIGYNPKTGEQLIIKVVSKKSRTKRSGKATSSKKRKGVFASAAEKPSHSDE